MATCAICQDNDQTAPRVLTPCGHQFHAACLASIQRPHCPLCKQDIRDFLTEQLGLDQTKIREREEEDDDRIMYESMCDHPTGSLSVQEIRHMISHQVTYNATELILVFRDILVDRIWDARRHFLAISAARNGNGVFTYFFEWKHLVAYALCPDLPSQAVWQPYNQDKFHDTVNGTINDLVERVRPYSDTDFAVCICLVDEDKQEIQIASRVLSTDPTRQQEFICRSQGGGYISGIATELRPSSYDIVTSLAKGTTCRCSGHQPLEPNPEFQWAKRVHKRIKQNQKKYLNSS